MSRVFTSVFVILAAFSAAVRADTQWIGPANGLWGDPGNWTDGVPASASQATINLDHSISAMTPIDLGGVVRPVGTLTLVSPYARLTNGSLLADAVTTFYSVDPFGPTLSIGVPITSTSPKLILAGVSGGNLHIDAPVTGNGFAVEAKYTTFSAANTYSGDTIVTSGFTSPGSVVFKDQGSALQSVSFQLAGRQLYLDNSSVNLSDRLNDAAPIHFVNGGVLRINGNATAATSERVGLLDLGISGSVWLSNRGQPVTLRASAIQHDQRGFAHASFTPAAGDRILLDTPPAMVGGGVGAPATGRGIIPWLLDLNDMPFTYDAGDPGQPQNAPGLRPLNPATEFASSIPAPSAFPANVQISVSQTVTGEAIVNFMAISGATLTLNHSNVSVNSNTAVFSSATVSGIGTLQFSGNATLFGGGVHLDVPIKAHSLTLTGNDAWYLSQPNDLPGGINLSYRAIVTHPLALGSGRVHLDEGMRLELNFPDATLTNDFAFGDTYATPPAFPGYDYLTTTMRSSANSTITFKGNWSGDLATIGFGGGLFRLDGNGAFDSLHIIGSGAFELNGTIGPARTTPEFISLQGNLAGNGTFIGIVSGGIVAPGPIGKPGRLTVHQMFESELDVDLTGPTAGLDYDQLVITGDLGTRDPGGLGTRNRLYVNLALNFVPTVGESFLIVDNQLAGSPAVTFSNLPEGSFLIASNIIFQVSYVAGDGNDVSLTVVPEPSVILLGTPLLMALGQRRRRLG
jgi:hypothetical protein